MQSGDHISAADRIVDAVNTIPQTAPGEIREQIISLINNLINHDFYALVQLLYRIDVDEGKLKKLLAADGKQDAAAIIADLIINRQLQKIANKTKFSSGDTAAPGNDSW